MKDTERLSASHNRRTMRYHTIDSQRVRNAPNSDRSTYYKIDRPGNTSCHDRRKCTGRRHTNLCAGSRHRRGIPHGTAIQVYCIDRLKRSDRQCCRWQVVHNVCCLCHNMSQPGSRYSRCMRPTIDNIRARYRSDCSDIRHD